MPENQEELARILAGHVSPKGDDFNLEKAVVDGLSRQKWGKDAPWYLPESLVGDIPYRYQGVGLHGAIAAAGLPMGPPGWLFATLPNAAYVGGTMLAGRTQRPKIGEEGVPVLKGQPY